MTGFCRSLQQNRDKDLLIFTIVCTISYIVTFLNFVDCPGSIEFAQETDNALMGVDAGSPANPVPLPEDLKAVEEAPEPIETAKRREIKGTADAGANLAQVLKTYYTPQGWKLSLVRVWQGKLTDNMTLNGVRAGGMYRLMGDHQESIQVANAGEICAIARLETVQTGDTLSDSENVVALPTAKKLVPVYAMAIVPEKRKDEVKLSSALTLHY